MNCELCQNTGYRSVEVNQPDGGRTSYAVKCDHGKGANAPAGGFQQIGQFSDRIVGVVREPPLLTNGPELIEQALARHAGDLSPEEIQIARLIGRRVGQAAAIRIADLIKALGGGCTDRDIKAMVERLRTVAKLRIAATKAPPYGYFTIGSDAEGREFHDRHMREAIKHIRVAQLFHEDTDLLQELRGQLELGNAEL